MFSDTEKEWILEAINHLKHRKARPDFTRISLRMKRKYQMGVTQTKKLLESLIESGIVIKVVYKNSTSYRDGSKWKKGRLGGQIMNSSRMLKRFIKAIRETETSKDTGVSAKSIEEYLCSKVQQKCYLAGAALRDALEKEIENGFLFKRELGNTLIYRVHEEHVRKMLPDLDLDSIDLDDTQDDNLDANLEEDPDPATLSSSSISKNFTLFSAEHLFSVISDHVSNGYQNACFDDIKLALYKKGIAHADTSITACLEENVSKGLLETLVNNEGIKCYALTSNCENLRLKLKNQSSDAEFSLCPTDIHKKLDVVTSSLELFQKNMSAYSNANKDKNAPLRPPSKRKVSGKIVMPLDLIYI